MRFGHGDICRAAHVKLCCKWSDWRFMSAPRGFRTGQNKYCSILAFVYCLLLNLHVLCFYVHMIPWLRFQVHVCNALDLLVLVICNNGVCNALDLLVLVCNNGSRFYRISRKILQRHDPSLELLPEQKTGSGMSRPSSRMECCVDRQVGCWLLRSSSARSKKKFVFYLLSFI